MTVTIEVQCDGLDCYSSHEIDNNTDSEIEHIGWLVDYETGFHYCRKCSEIVKKEIGNKGDE